MSVITQLSLLPQFERSTVIEIATYLIHELNDGRKPKECYNTLHCYPFGRIYVFMATGEKGVRPMFNVLDNHGKIPDGFPANWRVWQHIHQELGLQPEADNL